AEQTGIRPTPPTDAEARALTRSRAMLDFSYAGSPIVGGHPTLRDAANGGPAPGERLPEACDPVTSHRLLLGGGADQAAADRLRDRWRGLVDVTDVDGAGQHEGGCTLVRPDGFVGFRSAAADETALKAVDAHLESYLIPDRARHPATSRASKVVASVRCAGEQPIRIDRAGSAKWRRAKASGRPANGGRHQQRGGPAA